MQKAQVAATMYFWRKYSEKTGMVSPFDMNRYKLYVDSGWKIEGLKMIYILLKDQGVSFCNYDVCGSKTMSSEVITEALEIIYEQNMVPVYIGVPDLGSADNNKVNIKIIDSSENYVPTSEVESVVYVYNRIQDVINRVEQKTDKECSCIFVVDEKNIPDLSTAIKILDLRHLDVKIFKRSFSTWTTSSVDSYKAQLVDATATQRECLDDQSLYSYQHFKGLCKDNLKCDAGVSSFTLAPNGNIYPCPAFYYESPDDSICRYTDMRDGLGKSSVFYRKDKSPVCRECDNKQCRRCVFDNLHRTGNINIPSYAQCDLATKEQSVFSNS